MKNTMLFLLAALLFGSVPGLAAESRATGPALETPSPDSGETFARVQELLGQLAAGFRAMPAYTVRFEIVADDSAVRGGYSVQGEAYYLQLGDAEVFADGATRYEVDNRRREVTIVELDTASRNILDNPVRAFDFLDSAYRATLLDERDGEADILLTPTGDAGAVSGAVTLTVTTSPVRPRLLTYDYDGERITVAVTGISPLQTPLRRFDRAAYVNYELIDFR